MHRNTALEMGKTLVDIICRDMQLIEHVETGGLASKIHCYSNSHISPSCLHPLWSTEGKAQKNRGMENRYYNETSSIRSSASFASSASASGTLIGFTTFPATRFSSAQARCCGSMRAMVEHMHIVGAMNWIIFPSGLNSSAIRPTRFNSVPTSQRVPGSASRIVLIMYS